MGPSVGPKPAACSKFRNSPFPPFVRPDVNSSSWELHETCMRRAPARTTRGLVLAPLEPLSLERPPPTHVPWRLSAQPSAWTSHRGLSSVAPKEKHWPPAAARAPDLVTLALWVSFPALSHAEAAGARRSLVDCQKTKPRGAPAGAQPPGARRIDWLPPRWPARPLGTRTASKLGGCLQPSPHPRRRAARGKREGARSPRGPSSV
ncbi:unnamed protein product [Prorocentrum cordatum]|uniref:Uncharacterized protein n=1 Tax=Prorocentrum cordatum TaxID=2364126 RepID=A0ABN9VTK2_9DINO|nr:unnamed protein product [Polarella glacialis]